MKILLTLFVLLFSSSVFAEDISDFEIEGISIGDSLLDHFTEEEIKNNIEKLEYKNNEFYHVGVYGILSSKFKVYDAMQISLKTNDKNYIIYSLGAGIFYQNNINDCYSKQTEIFHELKTLFASTKITDKFTFNHSEDKSGESKVTAISFDFESTDGIRISCFDWSKNFNFTDHLKINIDSKEYVYWITNKAY